MGVHKAGRNVDLDLDDILTASLLWGHFLAFKSGGRKQRNGCVQDVADHFGQ